MKKSNDFVFVFDCRILGLYTKNHENYAEIALPNGKPHKLKISKHYELTDKIKIRVTDKKIEEI